MSLAPKMLMNPRTERLAFVLAILGLFALSAGLVLYNPEDPSVKGSVIGSIQTQGMVRRRHSRSLLWKDLYETSSLYQLDYVYVPEGESADITLGNGVTLTLPAGTMVQFDSLDGRTYELDLIAGNVKPVDGITLKAKESFFVRWKDTRLLEYLPSLESEALKQQEFLDRLSQNLAKPARINKLAEPNFQPYTLTGLDQFELELVSPINNATVRSSKGEWVDAVWTPIPLPDTSYVVQVSQRKEFDFFVSYQTTFNAISLQVQESGLYYWRVIAKQGKKQELMSAISSFKYQVTSKRLNPLLGRLTSSTVGKYTIEISKTEDFKNVLTRQTSDRKKCSTSGLKPGEYFCRVRVGDSDKTLSLYPFSVKP